MKLYKNIVYNKAMPSISQGLNERVKMKRVILNILGAATIAAILCLPFAVWDYQAPGSNKENIKG